MKTTRHLKSWVQTALIIAGIVDFFYIWTFDHHVHSVPMFIAQCTLYIAIIIILGKWGTWRNH